MSHCRELFWYDSNFEACSVNAFKAHLDKVWSHQDVKFDFRASLIGTGNRSELYIELH